MTDISYRFIMTDISYSPTCIQPAAPRTRAAVLMCGGRPGVRSALAAVAVITERERMPSTLGDKWSHGY